MSSADEVWAVVVNWNGGELNLACLRSLVGEGLAPERVVFVDNASGDGSLSLVRDEFPGLQVIANERNLGFGEAANQGARLALERGASGVFYVNNDLTLEPGCLGTLSAYLRSHPEVGAVGPRVLMAEDPTRVWCAGGRLDHRQNLSTLIGFGKPDGPKFRSSRPVDYLAGCALLVRREVLAAVGGFDAEYFAYMEDVDLCLQIRRAGHEVHLVGEAAALHRSSSSTGGGYNPRRKYMMGVNSVRFLRKHGSARAWAGFWLWDVLPLPLLWLVGLATGRSSAVAAKARGIWAGLRGKVVSSADALG